MSQGSRLFGTIGEQIKSFIDLNDEIGTYDIDRMATVNIKSDDVRWSLENKLKADNAIDSELRVAKDINNKNETLSLITSTTKNPTFTFETNRYNFYVNITGQLQYPNWKLGLFRNYSSNYSFDIQNEYNQDNNNILSNLGLTYIKSKDLIFGFRTKIYGKNNTMKGILDYSLNAEYNPDSSKMFYAQLNGTQPNDFDEEEAKGSMDINVGCGFKHDIGTIYSELKYDITTSKIDAGLGLNRELDSNSDISVVARLNRKLSVLYSNDLKGVNASIKAGANISMNNSHDTDSKAPINAKMQWKLTFGDTFTKDDFGALGDSQREL